MAPATHDIEKRAEDDEYQRAGTDPSPTTPAYNTPEPSRKPSLIDAESAPGSRKFEDEDDGSDDNDISPTEGHHGGEHALEKQATGAHSMASTTRPAMSAGREVAFVLLTSSAQLLTQAGMAISIAPLHIMSDSFGSPSAGQLSWFTAAYSLSVGTFILIAGRLGDMFGHRRLFVCGWAWYSVWSLVAGLTVYSGSQIFLDVCRALQGVGPAVLLPSSLALLGRTYPPGRRKEMVFAFYGATAPNGFTLGALFSSLLAMRAWWPWAYWILAIVCALNAVLAVVVVPGHHDEDTHEEAQVFDYWGALTGVCSLVLFNIAWNQGPVVGWDSPYVIVFVILGVLLFGVFLWIERRVAAQPLVPVDAFDSHVGFVLGCIALGWSSFGIWLYYFWQFAEELQGDTPLNVVAQFTPACVSGLCAAFTVGFLLSRVRTSWIMMAAMVCFCVGNVIFAVLPVGRLYWKQVFWSVLITPWGMDMSFPAATIILSNHVHKKHQGIAASLVTTMVNYSISWGLGIAGTVEVHVNRGGTDLLRGYRGAWYTGIGLAGLGVVMSVLFVASSYRGGKK